MRLPTTPLPRPGAGGSGRHQWYRPSFRDAVVGAVGALVGLVFILLRVVEWELGRVTGTVVGVAGVGALGFAVVLARSRLLLRRRGVRVPGKVAQVRDLMRDWVVTSVDYLDTFGTQRRYRFFAEHSPIDRDVEVVIDPRRPSRAALGSELESMTRPALIAAAGVLLLLVGFAGQAASRAEAGVLYDQAAGMLDNELWASAAATFEKSIDLASDDVDLQAAGHVGRSLALFNLERFDEAVAASAAAIALQPGDIILADAYVGRALALAELERHAEAEADLRAALELLPPGHELSRVAEELLAGLRSDQ